MRVFGWDCFDFLKGKKAAPEKPVSKETPVQEKPAAPATPLRPFQEKPAAPAAEPESASTPELPVSLEGTPEKFRPMAEELLPPLLELLRSLCALEAEIFARSQQLEADKLKAGHPQEPGGPWLERADGGIQGAVRGAGAGPLYGGTAGPGATPAAAASPPAMTI